MRHLLHLLLMHEMKGTSHRHCVSRDPYSDSVARKYSQQLGLQAIDRCSRYLLSVEEPGVDNHASSRSVSRSLGDEFNFDV